MVYKDLQRNFFLTLWRKVVTFEPQPLIESANIQTRYIQPGRSYASVTRTESKQSNANQKNQETQKKITTSSPEQLNKYYIEIMKYDERIYEKNGRNI